MKDSNYRIFRADALQRYSRGSQAPVFPRLISPPTFICLWVVLALLLTTGLAAWFFKFPIYVWGSAAVVSRENGEIVIVAFFSPEQLPRLRAGQTLFLSSRTGHSFSGTIVGVNREIISPDDAQRQFGGLVTAAQLINEPSAAVIAQPQAHTFNFPVGFYSGSVFSAEVEVGSQRVLSLLPAIRRFIRS